MTGPGEESAFPPLTGTGALVRRVAFRALLEGRRVGKEDLAAATGLGLDVLDRTLGRLAGQGRLALGSDGSVVAAGGLSTVPTRHRLRLGDQGSHTWCAIDAIGIPAALGADAVVETTCPHCGRDLRVEVLGGLVAEDHGHVAWDPGAICSNVMEEYCPDANLFCSSEHLDAWRTGNGSPPGRALSLDEVVELGRDWWGDLT